MRVLLRFLTHDHLDRKLSRWWAWLERTRPITKEMNFHSIDFHYSTAGPDRARNEVVREFLSTDANYLWMLDRDIVPPQNLSLLEATQKRDLLVLSGVYDGWAGLMGMGFTHVYKKMAEQKWVALMREQWPKEEIFRADAVGAGCLLMRREILEELADPWFEFLPHPGGGLIGEDFVFCDKLKKGVAVMQSYQCEHYREMGLSKVRELTEKALIRHAESQCQAGMR